MLVNSVLSDEAKCLSWGVPGSTVARAWHVTVEFCVCSLAGED